MVFTSPSRSQSSSESEEKYPALRVVLVISKLIVVLFAIATLVVAYQMWRSPNPNKVALGLLSLLIGAMVCLFQWASIEVVEVVLDIEENTRRTADRDSSGTT
jgi:uncharacterized membrane protein